jgi:transcriptional regulator with XRE-family HTH domain
MTKKEIGEFIRLNRQAQKLSQQQLAEKAGITRRQQIIEMESSSTDYGIDVLIKVVTALGFSVRINVPTQLEWSEKEKQLPSQSEPFDFSKIEAATEEPTKKPNLKIKKVNKNAKENSPKRRKTVANGKAK